jgi:sigma-E factor negative regulatory protein RseA
MNEKLSVLMDGELGELETRRVLQELGRDPELRAAWERYHVVRDALRGELELEAESGLADRVAQRLVSLDTAPRAWWRGRGARAAGTVAIAASVAVVALAGLQFFAPPTVPATLAERNAPAVTQLAAGQGRWKTQRPEVEQALNAYLVEHNDFAAATGPGGMLPYVRVVGYGPEK